MKKHLLLSILFTVFITAAWAQLPGWGYYQPITITNSSATALTDYQMRIVVNTQALVAANQMRPDGADIRFGSLCTGGTPYDYWIDSGMNSAATSIWVKIPLIAANSNMTIHMFYGNATATPASTIGIFNGPFSSTNQVSGGSTNTVSDCQRGYRFSPNTDILVTEFGKNTPDATTRWATLFNFTTQAILRQIQVAGPAATYTYANLPNHIWLTQGTQYLMELHNGTGDMYYYQTTSQIHPSLTYYDMRYCNSCNQNTFPTLVLTNYHYGYPDFRFYTRTVATTPPTYVFGGSSGGGGLTSQPQDTTICVGSNAVFAVSGTGTITYQWQVNQGSGFNNISNAPPYSGVTTSTLVISAPPASMSGYQYRVVTSGGCGGAGNSDTAILTVATSLTPTLTVTSNTSPASICANNPITFTAAITHGGSNPQLQWRLNGNNIPGATGMTYTLPANTFGVGDIVSCVLTSSLSCANPATVTSSNFVIQLPPGPATTNYNYCLNDPFIPIVVNGPGLKWYSIPKGGVATTTTPTVNTAIPGSYTWYVSQTSAGCESDRSPLTVTVATPPPPPLVEPLVYCQGEENVPQLIAGGQNLKWYKSSTGGIGTTIAPTPQTGVEGLFSWYVSQTVNGCEGPRARLDVKVVFKPNVLIQTTDDELCEGEQTILTYYGSGLPTHTYNWGLPPGATLISGTGMGPLTVRFDSAGINKVNLQVSNEGCYSIIGIKNIEVKAIPTGDINSPYNACEDAVSLVVLDYYSPNIDSFFWDFGGGELIHEHQDVGPYGIIWREPGEKVIKLTVKNEECSAVLYDTIMVRPTPDASFSGAPSTAICAGDSIRLTANNIDPASDYQWQPERFFDDYSKQPVTHARIDFRGPLSLTVTDEFGCKKSDSVLIETRNCCIVSFPTAFTPDGNGRNDYFRPITEANINIKTFRVVNRWGQTVFESADQYGKGWDGTISGEPLDMGTYHYFVAYICNGVTTEQKGDVVLIR